MGPKISFLVLLACVALLTGCNQANAPNAKATFQVGGSDNAATTAEEVTAKQKEEELRLANERLKLAEERADLEKQKREFAEQKLKELQDEHVANNSAAASPTTQNTSASSNNTPSRQYSNHTRTPSFTWLSWDSDEPPPQIGEIIEDEDGVQYRVIGRQGNCIKGVRV